MRATFSLLGLLLSSVVVHAEPVEVRPSAPIAQFTLPDNWETKRIERGVQTFSPDEEVYLWIEAYKPDEFPQILAEHNAYWKKQGVIIASSDQEKHQEGGKEVSITTEHATWNGKPTVLYYVEFQLGLPSQSNIVLTYWASPKGDQAFHKEVGDVLESLNVTEK